MRKTRELGNHMIIVVSSFLKSSVLKMFSFHRFHDKAVWTVGLTVEIIEAASAGANALTNKRAFCQRKDTLL